MKCLNGIFNTEGLFWNLHAILFWEIIFCLLMCAFYSSWFIPNEFLLIYQGFELVDYVARLVKIYISSFEGSFIHSFKCVIHFHLFRFLLKKYIYIYILFSIKIWKRIRNQVFNLITYDEKSQDFFFSQNIPKLHNNR